MKGGNYQVANAKQSPNREKDSSEILFLSRKEIENLLTPADVLDICDKTFKWINSGEVKQIIGKTLETSSPDWLLPYPAYIKPLGVAGVKWLSNYWSNIPRGLPFNIAIDILNDAETGVPIAIMEGMFITSMRTAGHAAVGAKYLAKRNSEVVAILGCGFEAGAHLRLMNELFKLKEVRVCDLIASRREKLCAEIRERLDLNMSPFESAKETLKGADIVIELTTSKTPTFSAEWIEPGCYVAGPNIFGIPPQLSKKADKWVIGNWEKDLKWIKANPEYSDGDIYASLDEVAAGEKPGRETEKEITLMTHYGMGALDVSAMHLVYNMAVKKGIGTRLKLT